MQDEVSLHLWFTHLERPDGIDKSWLVETRLYYKHVSECTKFVGDSRDMKLRFCDYRTPFKVSAGIRGGGEI